MATTTNYNFEIPDDTDLVKDGALAMRDLGQDVDTAMFTALDGKKAGMVLINTTSFSAVSTVSFNNVFTSTFSNYKIVLSNGLNSNISNVTFRFRVSGTDNSSSNYFMQRSIVNQSGTGSAGSDNALTLFNLSANTVGVNLVAHSLDVVAPNLTSRSFLIGSGFTEASASFGSRFYGGQFNATTSFDGFTIATSSGTFSGTIEVYGYQD
jgi:hypothetical protein